MSVHFLFDFINRLLQSIVELFISRMGHTQQHTNTEDATQQKKTRAELPLPQSKKQARVSPVQVKISENNLKKPHKKLCTIASSEM